MSNRPLVILLLSLLLIAVPVAGELQDPTRPPAASRPQLSPLPGDSPTWTLNATLVSPARRVAVINGQAVGEGEMIGGARLIRVAPETAILRQGGNEFTLRLAAAGKSFNKTILEEKK
ncbi:MAG: general secretion pathway protein GspB [Desulfuromonadales bacterium]|nr:general secretion pathway protein GspB [Desulfuromonadales bacterium]